jgi:outer membrane protein W
MNGLRITLAAGVAAALACTSFASAAHADEESGLAVGVRVAYAIPFGNAHNASSDPGSTAISMKDLDRGALPVTFDLGYRFSPSTYLGVFYTFAPTFPPSGNCRTPLPNTTAGETTCDGNDQKIGIDFQYHIRPKAFLDPWVGIGVGYEINQLNTSTGASSDTSSYQTDGFLVDLQLGADLRVSHRIPFGPYIDFSAGQYNTENVFTPNGHGVPVDFSGTLHEWLTLGLRAQFNL